VVDQRLYPSDSRESVSDPGCLTLETVPRLINTCPMLQGATYKAPFEIQICHQEGQGPTRRILKR
jgi:hypothetical protein